MAELPDLDPIPGVNVSDDDLLLIFDIANTRAYKITRGTLLGNVARESEDAEFANLSAEEITCTQITPAQIVFAAGGGIADMVTASESVAVPTVASQATGSVGVTVTGAVVGMAALVTFTDALAAGLCCDAYVSAADTVTLRFTNATAGSITGETKAAKIALIEFPV